MRGMEAKNLTKTYPLPNGGILTALNDVSFHVRPGEIFGLIGPNGAGKTTTMRILAGLLTPDLGAAFIEDREIREDCPVVKRDIGWMPDFFGVYGELRVWEYIDFFAAIYQIPSREARIDEVLAKVGLTDKRGARVGELSRGMVQRICLARALVHNPPVLLLDEPASGLDPHARNDLRRLVRELSEEGRAILISSHILVELQELVTHVGILERGRMVYSGPASGVGAHTEERAYEIRLEAGNHLDLIRRTVPDARDIRAVPTGVMILMPAEIAASVILAKLIQAGVPVTHFSEARDLESLFLRTTTGQTQ